MSVAAVNNIASQYNPTTDAASRITKQTLNQDDFLQLVVAQLSNQDPMNPQSDTEFIAQMAQFTSLEQSKSMQGDIAQLRTDQQFLQANALIGRNVQVKDSQNAPIAGTVSAVKVVEGTPQIVVNGTPYDLSALLTIEASTDTSQK